MRLLATVLFTCAVSLAAQSPSPASALASSPESSPPPVEIQGQVALAHRIGHDKPVYSRFGLAAGVSGIVKVSLIVGPDGSIQRQSDVTGPPALIASAQAWIAASHFRPFLRDGQPVAVHTTLPIVFRLQTGTHSAHPLPAIYQRNITTTIDREGRDNPPRVRWPALSPAMHDWIARYEAALPAGKTAGLNPTPDLTLDQIVASQNGAQPLARTPGNLAIYLIPLTLLRHRLYLFFEFSDHCGKSNCPLVLLEESPVGVHTVVSEMSLEADLHRRHDSPYPDVLIWSDSGQAGISSIAGFSYYGGEWGQLYCGTDDANEDSERDEDAVEHHRLHVPQSPLVTLCK
jgi:hypothetical protein